MHINNVTITCILWPGIIDAHHKTLVLPLGMHFLAPPHQNTIVLVIGISKRIFLCPDGEMPYACSSIATLTWSWRYMRMWSPSRRMWSIIIQPQWLGIFPPCDSDAERKVFQKRAYRSTASSWICLQCPSWPLRAHLSPERRVNQVRKGMDLMGGVWLLCCVYSLKTFWIVTYHIHPNY